MNCEQVSAATAAVAKGPGNRVSVACLPCRRRHVRCDSRQPICVRCSSEGKTCQYLKSRRGGLDRARLAERRLARNGAVADSPSDTDPESRPVRRQAGEESIRSGGNLLSLPLENSAWPTEEETVDHDRSYETSNPTTAIQFTSVGSDFLVKLYYEHFHRCHPCVLPQHDLQRLYERTTDRESLTLLIDVMRFIGSLYSCPDFTSRLRDKVVQGLRAAKRLTPDPFLVQSHLLYSIALYWSAEKAQARDEINTAIEMALDLGMNHRLFAAEHGRGDAVLQESLRRTWWQLYCTDAYYAAIKRSPTFPLCEVDVDTELPCEEHEYESGVSFSTCHLFFSPHISDFCLAK